MPIVAHVSLGMHVSTHARPRTARPAFTLVELIVVVGVIAILIAVLLPVITQAMAASRTVRCAANVRRLCEGLQIYATANRGSFPPNTSSPRRSWYDADRLGWVLTPSQSELRGPVATCPEDPDAYRSYAMNAWAGSAMDPVLKASAAGVPWRASTPKGNARLILVTERWSSGGNATFGWFSPAAVGDNLATPGQRFGGGGGIVPMINAGRWKLVRTDLAYNRHRARKGPGAGTDPVGRVQIGYADGHVALRSNTELVDASGRSTRDSLWSPADEWLEQ